MSPRSTTPAAPPAMPPATRLTVGLIVLAAVAVRIAHIDLPTHPDEGGYLLAAAQWHPGTSTYGNHFVDRPPLLMGIHALAHHLAHLSGTEAITALRLLGILAVTSTIVLAARLGGRTHAVPAALTAAALLTTASFDPFPVNGELLATPFVLLGAWALIQALDNPHRTAHWAALAGVAATSAFLVKQNVLDVFVIAAVLLLAAPRRHAGALAAFAAATLTTTAIALGLASLHGTTPTDLWDAVVQFRLDAAISMQNLPDDAADARRTQLLTHAALSGLPLVVIACLLHATTTWTPARTAAVAVLTWEALGLVAGGGWWSHYLIALTPGVVLLVASTATLTTTVTAMTRPARALWAAITALTLSALVQLATVNPDPSLADADAAVVAHLRTHAQAGDTVVVAHGHPNVIHDAGLTSPYLHLWTLPTRVRDPELHALEQVLQSPVTPDWLVLHHGDTGGLGIDPRDVTDLVTDRYRTVGEYGGWHVLHRRG